MRPRGEVREAIARAAQSLAEQGTPPTWRELVGHVKGMSPASPADVRLVRKTVENMAQAGELVRAGERRVQGVARPMTQWKPRGASWVHQGAPMLDGIVRGWRA